MPGIATYLFFDGSCEAAFTLYADVLQAEIVEKHHYRGSPMADQIPADFSDKIMHIELRFAGQALMGADRPMPQPPRPMVGAALLVTLPTVADAETAFARLAEGGTVQMPLQQTFWSPAFGTLTDRFGVNWSITGEA